MIMRNSVILVDQIDQDILDGSEPAERSSTRRCAVSVPIMLTAAAAVLAMIPAHAEAPSTVRWPWRSWAASW
jgi:multidrug efflux pump subunit AcrB